MDISINPRQRVEMARGAAGTCIQGSGLRTDLTNLVAVELRMVAFLLLLHQTLNGCCPNSTRNRWPWQHRTESGANRRHG
jgi:hypothetical protein